MEGQDHSRLLAPIDGPAVSIVVDQKRGRPLGTGFYFLSPKYFVTAKHVVFDRDAARTLSHLVLMQRGPDYPRAEVVFLHPTRDIAVLRVHRPACTVPLYPGHERLLGQHGLRYFGYAPQKSDKGGGTYQVVVVDLDHYERESRERDDGVEQVFRFTTAHAEPGHSGGPVLGVGGGVVGIITEGHQGWVRATEIQALMDYVEFPAMLPAGAAAPL